MTSQTTDRRDRLHQEYWEVFTRWAWRVLGPQQLNWYWTMNNTPAGQRFSAALCRFGLQESFMYRRQNYERGLRGSIMEPPPRLMIRTIDASA
jgi:hypothetical protein